MIVNSFFVNFVVIVAMFRSDSVSSIHGLFPHAIDATSSNHIAKEIWRHIKSEEYNYASRIKMKIYTGSSISRAAVVDVPLTEPDIIFQYIDHSKPLVLYVHGFREHPTNESIRTVVGAYLERGTDNIFLLDWSDLAFDKYLKVITRVRDIAKILANVFDGLVDLGLDLETFHLVGHSLGAQIGGFFGRYSNKTIPRITGLDPAFPGFYHLGAEHIDADSATFVDILHTDAGFYGALSDTGTCDFYANMGTRPQPGCPFLGVPLTPSDLCNHHMSWRYYAETVKNNFAFIANECSSYLLYSMGMCKKNRQVFFGYATPTNSRGSYYFRTGDRSPYGNNIVDYSWSYIEAR